MFDKSTKILVVDDMMTMRKIVIKNLRELGYEHFVEAADGQKAWEAMQADPTLGLVVSDWNMPNCSGVDLLKRVRADGVRKLVPFVLLTAESESHQVAEAVKSGVDNYIVKPFSADSLKTKLSDTFKKVQPRLGL